MVVIDAGQPVIGRVVGHGHAVRVPSVRSRGEQLTEEEEETYVTVPTASVVSRVTGSPEAGVLPGINHAGDVSAQRVGAGQSAEEVQVDGAEGSNRPIGASAEDELLCDGQTGGLGRLTDRWTDRWSDRWTDRQDSA